MILLWITNNLRLIGLVAALCSTFTGQAHLVGEPWNHWLILVGAACSTTIAYFMQPPRDENSHDRVSDSKLQELNK